MKVVERTGHPNIATVYVAQSEAGDLVEYVESVEPPIPRNQKWVNIISTLYGCPVKCQMCDAGMQYRGRLSTDEMLFQVDDLVQRRYPDRVIPCEKWKIQFARMGDPAFNPDVLELLRQLPAKYEAPGLFPSLSTIAPAGCDRFFDQLIDIKRELYPERFQFQFSLHTTDENTRRRLIPVRTWSFDRMGEYGEAIYGGIGRRPTLNFALMQDVPVQLDVLLRYFSPDVFLIKLTPLNPTFRSRESGLASLYDTPDVWNALVDRLRNAGYPVIESVGELEENAIGSNCGQYIEAIRREEKLPEGSYTYSHETI